MVPLSTDMGFNLKYILEWLWNRLSSCQICSSAHSPVLKQLKYRVIIIGGDEHMWYMDMESRLHAT